MSRLFLLILLLPFLRTHAQISGEDAERADLFQHKLGPVIDSTKPLKGHCALTYSHDSILSYMHVTDSTGAIKMLSAEYPDNIRTDFSADFPNYILLKFEGRGACNPSYFTLFNKSTKKGEPVGDFPIYINETTSIIIYLRRDTLALRNLNTPRTEMYKLPHEPLVCDNNYEVASITRLNITLKYFEGDKEKEVIKLKRH